MDLKNNIFKKLLIIIFISYFWTAHNSELLMLKWGWDLNKIIPIPMFVSQILSISLMVGIFTSLSYYKRIDKKIILIFFGYLVWFLILFLAYAPGCMTEDSYYTFHMVKNGWWSAWYSTLHPALITALLQIFPVKFLAPGLALSVLWAIVFSLIHSTIFLLNSKRFFHFLVPLLALTPAVIVASLIIIRDSYFTALFILFLILIFRQMFFYEYKKILSIYLIGLISAILIIYRADAIPSVGLGLLIIFFANFKKNSIKNTQFFLALSLPVILIFTFFGVVPKFFDDKWVHGNSWESRSENEYKLTLIENPLGYIVSNSSSIIKDSDKNSIEKVFKFSDLSQYYCPQNLCVFYGGYWNKNSTLEERNSAFFSALNIFITNPLLFIESRLKTVETVGDRNSQTTCSRLVAADRGYESLKVNKSLYNFGDSMISFMRNTENVNGRFGGSTVWWNVYFWASFCLLVILTSFWTPISSIFSLLLLIRTSVVFFAAPAGFTIYYLTLFIGGPVLFIFWILEFKKYINLQKI
jgi:hypothetical protein